MKVCAGTRVMTQARLHTLRFSLQNKGFLNIADGQNGSFRVEHGERRERIDEIHRVLQAQTNPR